MTTIDYRYVNNASGMLKVFSPSLSDVASRLRSEPVVVMDVQDRQGTHIVARASWYLPTIERLLECAELDAGWDSYGALPTTTSSMTEAMRFVAAFLTDDSPTPSVVPLSDGGVQLEWHRGGVDIEAAFRTDDPPQLYLHDHETDEEHEVGAWSEPALIHAFVARLQD